MVRLASDQALMMITVTDAVLGGLRSPKFAGPGCLSTDLITGDNLSHPRTSVRGEGR